MNIGAIHQYRAEYFAARITNVNADSFFSQSMGRGVGLFGSMETSAQDKVTQYASPQEIYLKETNRASIDMQNVKDIATEHYDIKVDREAKRLRIYDKEGNNLGSYAVDDVRIRRDTATGTEVMISEFGSMGYNAVPLNQELKEGLSKAISVEQLESEELKGYSVKTHRGTGIKYLMRDGEEGRGGKTLITSPADQAAFDKLVNTYATKYPNLIGDPMGAAIHADLEIRGLAQHTPNGFMTMGWDSLHYYDESNSTRNWGITFGENSNGYGKIMDWLENSRMALSELEKIKSWTNVFQTIGSYERIWSKAEMEQGYLFS